MNSSAPTLFRYAHIVLPAMVIVILGLLIGLEFFISHSSKLTQIHTPKRLENAVRTFEKGIKVKQSTDTIDFTKVSEVAEVLKETFQMKCPNFKLSAANLHKLVNYLKIIDDKLSTMTPENSSGDRPLSKRYILNLSEWINTICIQIKNPQKEFSINENDILAAAKLLTIDGGQAFEQAIWREREPRRIELIPGIFKEQELAFEQYFWSRNNPWSRTTGCVYITDGFKEATTNTTAWFLSDGSEYHDKLCQSGSMKPPNKDLVKPALITNLQKEVRDSDAWIVPDSIQQILSTLHGIRDPQSKLFKQYFQYFNQHLKFETTDLNENKLEVGFNIYLTIDPSTQRIAQQVANCYTGNAEACKLLNLEAVGKNFYEGAAVRMVGIAILDVNSGKIDALASAHSRCFEQQYNGPSRDRDCPNLKAWKPVYNRDMLLNHAIYTEVMPASIIKPIMALAFLRDRTYTALKHEDLKNEIASSNSKKFLNRMFCMDRQLYAGQLCPLPKLIETAAFDLGWNMNCEQANERCGIQDMLMPTTLVKDMINFDNEVLKNNRLYGRILVSPTNSDQPSFFKVMDIDINNPTVDNLRICQQDGWDKCKGFGINIVSEGWGQGNAKATPLGAASLVARLAAAANRVNNLPLPHIVERISFSSLNKHLEISSLPLRIDHIQAEVILQGMMKSHQERFGTAYSACKEVIKDDRKCNKLNRVAGKTGTPSFNNDYNNIDKINNNCTENSNSYSCRYARPYKWYIAAYKSNPQFEYFDKSIAVLTERNWDLHSGKVDAPREEGINRSAEIGFRIFQKIGILND